LIDFSFSLSFALLPPILPSLLEAAAAAAGKHILSFMSEAFFSSSHNKLPLPPLFQVSHILPLFQVRGTSEETSTGLPPDRSDFPSLVSSSNPSLYFLLNEHPSVSLALPPVGWQRTCEHPGHPMCQPWKRVLQKREYTGKQKWGDERTNRRRRQRTERARRRW